MRAPRFTASELEEIFKEAEQVGKLVPLSRELRDRLTNLLLSEPPAHTPDDETKLWSGIEQRLREALGLMTSEVGRALGCRQQLAEKLVYLSRRTGLSPPDEPVPVLEMMAYAAQQEVERCTGAVGRPVHEIADEVLGTLRVIYYMACEDHRRATGRAPPNRRRLFCRAIIERLPSHLRSHSANSMLDRPRKGRARDKAAKARAAAKPRDQATEEQFELFWNLYPRKVDEVGAREVFKEFTPDEAKEVIADAKEHADAWKHMGSTSGSIWASNRTTCPIPRAGFARDSRGPNTSAG